MRTRGNSWTAEDLYRLPQDRRYEIDDGRLVAMEPAGFEHARLAVRITMLLCAFVVSWGWTVLGGEPGVYLRRAPRQTLRAPDIAVYSRERAAAITDRHGFPDVPPDLAVEVHDRSERDLGRKIAQYLGCGVRAVWVVDPWKRTVSRHVPGEPPRLWTVPQDLFEEPLLAGFSCRVGDIFAED